MPPGCHLASHNCAPDLATSSRDGAKVIQNNISSLFLLPRCGCRGYRNLDRDDFSSPDILPLRSQMRRREPTKHWFLSNGWIRLSIPDRRLTFRGPHPFPVLVTKTSDRIEWYYFYYTTNKPDGHHMRPATSSTPQNPTQQTRPKGWQF